MVESNIPHLVEQAKRKDAAAFRKLCEIKSNEILYLCIKLMGSYEDGQDAAQEVFIKMHKKLGTLKDPAAFTVWLNRIVWNTCSNLRRSQRAHVSVPLEDDAAMMEEFREEFLPLEYAEEQEKRDLLLSAIHTLPLHYQEVLLLFYYQDLTLAEIAIVMDTTLPTVDHTLRRARRALKLKLEKGQAKGAGTGAFVGGAVVLPQVLHAEAAALASETVASQLIGGGRFIAYLSALRIRKIVTAVVATLSAATVVTFAVAPKIGLFTNTIPTSSPAGQDAGAVPQQPAFFVPAGEGITNIPPDGQNTPALSASDGASRPLEGAGGEEVGSTSGASNASSIPAASSSIPASSEAPGDTTTHNITLTGSTGLLDAEGNVVPGGAAYANGFGVELRQDGRTIARTSVDGQGSLLLTASVSPGLSYQLVVTPTSSIKCGFTTGSKAVVDIRPDGSKTQWDIGTLYLVDTEAPTATIQLLGPDGKDLDGGMVNPGTAIANVSDETPVATTWEIRDKATGTVLASGRGERVEDIPTRLNPPRRGAWYTLQFTATDIAGNTCTAAREIYLYEP